MFICLFALSSFSTVFSRDPIPQVLYLAQMVRTLSLLVRGCRLHGFVLGGALESANLENGPFLLPPDKPRLYHCPVVILDFASLYPSIFQAYNLCYTTLLHDADRDAVGADNVHVMPCTGKRDGAAFVRPHLRVGLLPRILGDLLDNRRAGTWSCECERRERRVEFQWEGVTDWHTYILIQQY